MPTATSSQIISSLYIATFNRAPDQAGLTYWQSKFTQDSESAVKQLAAGFTGHPAFTELYSNLNNLDFVNNIYQNVLGAQGDQDGVNYWTNSINNGMSRSDFLAAFVNSSLTVDINPTTFPDLTQAERDVAISRQNFLTNKANVGLEFTNTLGIKSNLLPTTDANILSGSNGLLADPAYQASIEILKGVNDTATSAIAAQSLIQAANASADPLNFILSGGSSGETFTLTTGTDMIPGLIGSNGSNSTAGNDIISAIIENSGTNGSTNTSTINSADTLNAGSGTDMLNVRITSLTGSFAVTPVLASIETVSASNADTSGNNVALNLALTTGTTTVEFKDTVVGSNTTFLDAPATAVISLNNADSSSGGQNVNLGSATDRSGTADAFAITIANGSGSSDFAAGFNLVTSDGTTDDTSFETANVTVAGTSSFVVAGTSLAALTTVNVSGSTVGVTTGYGLTLSQATGFDNLKTVNASGMTDGGLNIASLSDAPGFTFTGSSAVDRIFLFNSTINAASSLDGGASKDTLASLNLNNLSATAVNSATGFEVLEGAGGAETFDPSGFTGINEFLFTGTSGANNGFTVSNIESTDQIAYSTDITSGGNYALRLAGKNAGNTATVELRAINETNGETVFTATSNNNDRYGIEVQSNIASLTINSTGTSTNANVIETNLNATYFGYAFGNSSTVLFNITGSHDLAIMAKEGVDISDGTKLAGFSDAVSVDATSFTGSLRIAGSLSADSIKGGSNNDIIYSLGGADTLTGNGGADQFRLAKYYSTTDTITDFTKGTDKVGLNQFDFGNTTETQAGATLSITDYVENRAAITSIGAADALKVIELQTSLSGGQIAADSGAAVEAYILVHNTTSGKAELWYDNNWSDAAGRNQIVTFDNVVDLVGVQGFANSDFVEYTY